MNTEPATLLREFLATRSEAAFSALVRAQIDLVYSAARRICAGDTHFAEDITQTVFADLARKAARLPHDIVLSAWLYRHTFFVASSMIRTERRRRAREQEAVAMNATHETAEPDWALLAPHLDEAMNALAEADRRALVLRYFDKLDLRAVGERLGVSEDTAQKRVARALERLKTRFARKGVTVSLTALAASLLAHAVSAAPAVLAVKMASAVLAGVATGSGILIALEKLMTMNALKPLAAALAVAGVATPLFLQHQSLAAARDQNASLGAQVAELDELRAENERLAKLAVDYRELERLRGEHLELMRLRGEATLMRNELDALKREFERHRQLLLAKGVSEEELLAEAEREARRQVLIKSFFAEVPLNSPVWGEFGLQPPASGGDGHLVLTLDADVGQALRKRLEQLRGVNLMAAPRVLTANGREARVSLEEQRTIVTGRNGAELTTEQMSFGPGLQLIPHFETGGTGMNLKLVANVKQFHGYEEPWDEAASSAPGAGANAGWPVPVIENRDFEADVRLPRGQILVMTGGYSHQANAQSGAKLEGHLASSPSGLIVMIDPHEVDKAGNTVNP
jgi:RNA polymerase sigma factor (sigma-70 family)